MFKYHIQATDTFSEQKGFGSMFCSTRNEHRHKSGLFAPDFPILQIRPER